MSLIPSHYDPFCHDDWDPFQEFHYGGILIPIPHHAFPTETTFFMNSMIDWKETSDGHIVLKVDLPGFRKEEVKVEIEEDGVLVIRGEKRVEREEMRDHWHRVERSQDKFIRRVRLPENAMADKVKVFMENGVLTATIPKVKSSPHHQTRVVQISGY